MPRTKQFDETEVLEKAMHLFWKKGYHATSIQDLVDVLGINRASLYGTFGGKEALFDQAFAHYRKINQQGIAQLLESAPTVKEGIRQLFVRAVEDTLNDDERKGCFVVNATTELTPGDEGFMQLLAENKRHFEGVFLGYLQKGVEKGEISPNKDLQALAGLLFLLYNGLKVVGKTRPNRESLLASLEAALGVLD